MEQFCGTAVADEEIRLIAQCGSTVDIKGDFLNPRRIRYLILFCVVLFHLNVAVCYDLLCSTV